MLKKEKILELNMIWLHIEEKIIKQDIWKYEK